MGGIVKRSIGLAAVALVLFTAPGVAQEAPTTWSLEADIGLGGFIDPNAESVVDVTIASDLLLVGRLDLNAGGVTVSEAIEVPAGGVKTLRLEGAPVHDRRLVTVRLFDVAGEEPRELETRQLRVNVPLRQIVVGMLGADAAEPALRSVTPQPVDFDVELVRVDPVALERGLTVLDYLVVGDGSLAGLDPEDSAAVLRWVEDGGVLVGSPGDIDAVVDPGGAVVWPGTSVAVDRIEGGEVVAVGDVGSVDVEDWNVLLRGTQNPGLLRDSRFDVGPGLISAASAGREAAVPGLPWLLAGIAAFVILVGPVNFLVLRRVRRPELAWFTVPGLSVIFVAGFWFAGRAQVADAAVTTATVVIEADGAVEATAGAVVQVASAGDRTLTFPEGWQVAPSQSVGTVAGVRDDTDSGSITFELEDLGVGAAEARLSDADSVGVRIDFDADGAAVVTNDTEYTFWSWGLVVDGVGFVSSTRGDFVPDASDRVAVSQRQRGPRYEPVILELAQRRSVSDQNFYETTYQVLYALSYEAEEIHPTLTRDGTYFFGFTDSMETQMAVDGRRLATTGSTLLIKEFALPESMRAAAPVRPTLLDVQGSSTVEQYYDEIYAYGAKAVWFRYEVPENATGSAAIRPSITQLRVAEIFDWSAREFVPYVWGESLDLVNWVSPAGDLVLKASVDEGTEFFDESLQLTRFQLSWSTA